MNNITALERVAVRAACRAIGLDTVPTPEANPTLWAQVRAIIAVISTELNLAPAAELHLLREDLERVRGMLRDVKADRDRLQVQVEAQERGPMPLTDRQRKAYELLASFIAEHGFAPSLAEMARMLGLRSTASVAQLLDHLEERGWITRSFRHARRGVQLVGDRTKVPA